MEDHFYDHFEGLSSSSDSENTTTSAKDTQQDLKDFTEELERHCALHPECCEMHCMGSAGESDFYGFEELTQTLGTKNNSPENKKDTGKDLEIEANCIEKVNERCQPNTQEISTNLWEFYNLGNFTASSESQNSSEDTQERKEHLKDFEIELINWTKSRTSPDSGSDFFGFEGSSNLSKNSQELNNNATHSQFDHDPVSKYCDATLEEGELEKSDVESNCYSGDGFSTSLEIENNPEKSSKAENIAACENSVRESENDRTELDSADFFDSIYSGVTNQNWQSDKTNDAQCDCNYNSGCFVLPYEEWQSKIFNSEVNTIADVEQFDSGVSITRTSSLDNQVWDDPNMDAEIIQLDSNVRIEVPPLVLSQSSFSEYHTNPQIVMMDGKIALSDALEVAPPLTPLHESPSTIETQNSDDLPSSPVFNRTQQMQYLSEFKFPFLDKISKYTICHKLGEGTYGEVFAARSRKSNKLVAIKRLKFNNERSGFPITSLREIRILREVQHDNIIKFIEVCNSSNKATCLYFLVMEYCEFQFFDVQLPDALATIEERKLIMHQLLDGVHYIHDNKIIHRDLKTANILFTSKGILKIVDFGMARYDQRTSESPEQNYTNLVVTLWYRAPELLLGATEYSFPIDMWSVGCIFGELFTGTAILRGNNEYKQLFLMQKLCGSLDPKEWPDLQNLPLYNSILWVPKLPRSIHRQLGCTIFYADVLDLIDKLLIYDPKQRLTSDAALKHKTFSSDPAPAVSLEALMQRIKKVKIKQSVPSSQSVYCDTSFSSRIY